MIDIGCPTATVANASPATLPSTVNMNSVTVNCVGSFAFPGGATTYTFQCLNGNWGIQTPSTYGCTQTSPNPSSKFSIDCT